MLTSLALIIEDLQQDRGVYAFVITPVMRLVFSVVHRILSTATFVVVRCATYVGNCVMEVLFGTLETVYTVLETGALVAVDLFSLPLVIISASIHLLYSLVFGVLRLAQKLVTLCLFCATMSCVISMFHQGWKNIIRDLTLVAVDWVARRLPHGRAEAGDRIENVPVPGRRFVEMWPRLAEVLRVLVTVVENELRREGREIGRTEQGMEQDEGNVHISSSSTTSAAVSASSSFSS
nr:hypothetical protein BaRGS_012911 [Batillaria attramentaria]